MIQEKLKNLSWTQCNAIINHFQPSEEKISEVFGIDRRLIKNLGIFKPDPAFDVTPYYPLFNESEVTSATNFASSARIDTFLSKTKKPRGRPGNKIITAFRNIPHVPTDVREFADKWQVSISVLRQSLRFDKTGLPGKVHVRLNDEGTLVIWRDK